MNFCSTLGLSCKFICVCLSFFGGFVPVWPGASFMAFIVFNYLHLVVPSSSASSSGFLSALVVLQLGVSYPNILFFFFCLFPPLDCVRFTTFLLDSEGVCFFGHIIAIYLLLSFLLSLDCCYKDVDVCNVKLPVSKREVGSSFCYSSGCINCVLLWYFFIVSLSSLKNYILYCKLFWICLILDLVGLDQLANITLPPKVGCASFISKKVMTNAIYW